MTFNVGDPGHTTEHNRIKTEVDGHDTRIAALEAGGGGGGTGTVTEVNGVSPDGSGHVVVPLSSFTPNAGVATNDSRLSDARTPTMHAASHAAAGTDAVSPASIGALTAGAANALYPVLTASVLYVFEASGTYPVRATVTTSATQHVVWVGVDAPTIGGTFAVDGVDFWWEVPA